MIKYHLNGGFLHSSGMVLNPVCIGLTSTRLGITLTCFGGLSFKQIIKILTDENPLNCRVKDIIQENFSKE